MLAGHTYAASGTYTIGLTVTDDGGATAVTQQQVTVTVPPGGGGTGYVSLASPARVLDTRVDGTTIDAQFAAQGIRPGGSTLALTIAGRAGIPADAASVVLNVTVTEGQLAGYVTAYPCGGTQPTASNLNYVAAQTIPNLVIAKVGAGGAVCLFNNTATEMIVDVAGYFPGLDALTPLPTPARLLDTRADGTTVDGAAARWRCSSCGEHAGAAGRRARRCAVGRVVGGAERHRRPGAGQRLRHRARVRCRAADRVEPELRRRADDPQRSDRQGGRRRHGVRVHLGADASRRRRVGLVRRCVGGGAARRAGPAARHPLRRHDDRFGCSSALGSVQRVAACSCRSPTVPASRPVRRPSC